VKTLYDTKLDEELLIQLKEKYPALFDKPKDESRIHPFYKDALKPTWESPSNEFST
jgi:hypothetical protein